MPNLRRRSTTGITRPRRFITPRTYSGVRGTGVMSISAMISRTRTSSTPYSSPPSLKVRYLPSLFTPVAVFVIALMPCFTVASGKRKACPATRASYRAPAEYPQHHGALRDGSHSSPPTAERDCKACALETMTTPRRGVMKQQQSSASHRLNQANSSSHRRRRLPTSPVAFRCNTMAPSSRPALALGAHGSRQLLGGWRGTGPLRCCGAGQGRCFAAAFAPEAAQTQGLRSAAVHEGTSAAGPWTQGLVSCDKSEQPANPWRGGGLERD